MNALKAAVDAGGTAVLVLAPVAGAAATDALRARLSPSERARAARFVFAADRDAYVAAHAGLAALVERLEGPVPPARELVAAGAEKPRLHFADGRVLHVNLSHSRGLVAVAASRRVAVGVDVESRRAGELRDLYTMSLSARERQAVASAEHESASFLALWTRKEALLKALGIGLTDRLDEIDVLDPEAPRTPSAWSGRLPCGLTLRDLDPREGYGAVCVLERASRIATLEIGLDALMR